MKAIGIDIGTTSICGILIDAKSGTLLKKEERPNNATIKTEFSWERIQNPKTILETAFDVVTSLYDDDVISIGVTGQMHGIVYLDKDGNDVSPLYFWQDERGNLPYGETTYAKHLNSFTGYGYVTHFYNKENSLIPNDAVTFCTIHDFVAAKLAGNKKPVVHSTDAASFGQYDLNENKFTVNDSFLPEVCDDYKIIGKYKNADVSVAIGDNQASFIGSVCGSGSVLVNAGTGSQVSVVSDKIAQLSGIETRPFVEGKFLLVGCSLCGGKSFSLLENFFRKTVKFITGTEPDDVYSVMNKSLSKNEKTTLKIDNRFLGTRDNPEIRASITNLCPENFTPEDFLIAMVEGMADELSKMFSSTSLECENLIGSGNGIRKNPALKRALSEKFGKTLKVPAHKEEASFGAALFSLVASGFYPCISEAQKIIKYEV